MQLSVRWCFFIPFFFTSRQKLLIRWNKAWIRKSGNTVSNSGMWFTAEFSYRHHCFLLKFYRNIEKTSNSASISCSVFYIVLVLAAQTTSIHAKVYKFVCCRVSNLHRDPVQSWHPLGPPWRIFILSMPPVQIYLSCS